MVVAARFSRNVAGARGPDGGGGGGGVGGGCDELELIKCQFNILFCRFIFE